MFIKPKQQHLESTEDMVKELQEEVVTLKIESTEKDEKVKHFENITLGKEAKIIHLDMQLEEKNEKILELNSNIAVHDKDILKLTQDIKDAKRQYTEIRNSSSMNMEISRLLEFTIKRKEKELLESQEAVALSHHHVKELKEDMQQNKDEVSELKIEVTANNKKITALQKQIKTREDKIKILNEQILLKDGEIIDFKDKADFFEEKTVVQDLEIKRLSETSQRILDNVRHELSLPVGNVMNFAEMMSEQVDKMGDAHLKMFSDEVFQNSNRLSTMILNMLDLMSLEVEKLELKKEMVDITNLIQERVARCKKIYLDGKPIEIKMNLEPEIMANIDTHYIQQTVDNLVINAIKFSEKGTITISAHKKNDIIVIEVTDEGKGIPQMELYTIFTPFTVGSNSFSKAEGRGVGLALCRAAVQAHNGEIEAQSKNEVGAQFSLYFPC